MPLKLSFGHSFDFATPPHPTHPKGYYIFPNWSVWCVY